MTMHRLMFLVSLGKFHVALRQKSEGGTGNRYTFYEEKNWGITHEMNLVNLIRFWTLFRGTSEIWQKQKLYYCQFIKILKTLFRSIKSLFTIIAQCRIHFSNKCSSRTVTVWRRVAFHVCEAVPL